MKMHASKAFFCRLCPSPVPGSPLIPSCDLAAPGAFAMQLNQYTQMTKDMNLVDNRCKVEDLSSVFLFVNFESDKTSVDADVNDDKGTPWLLMVTRVECPGEEKEAGGASGGGRCAMA